MMLIYGVLMLAPVLTMMPSESSAHVGLEASKSEAGAYAKLTFRIPHGCEGSATTKITVQIPEGSLSVKPQVHAGWKIKTTKVKLVTPAVLHGKTITESISEVIWYGGVLADEYMDEFGVSLKLPEKSGKLVFPVIQECKRGVNRWVEIESEGHAHHATKSPAPFLILEAATIKK